MAWPSFPLVTTLLLRLIYGGLTLPAVTEYPVRVADTCAWDGFDAAVQRFSRVIQFKTVSDYSQPNHVRDAGEFRALDAFLQEAYPLVYKHMMVEKVGVDSLTYLITWKGSSPELRPILMISHIDVVPVPEASVKEWTYPPFSGAVADGFIWGRGTLDVKVTAVAMLEAASALLAQGWSPTRDVIFAFGHDEEVGGKMGAGEAAKVLASRGIQVEVIWDEGSSIMVDGVKPFMSVPVALVGTAEKGYQSVKIHINSRGGHASMPPIDGSGVADTMARVLARLAASPPRPRLTGPMVDMLRGLAPYAPAWMSVLLSSIGRVPGADMVVAGAMASSSAEAASLVRTTTAVTGVSAGVSDNVLPQQGTISINGRMLPGDTSADVIAHMRSILSKEDPSCVSLEVVNGTAMPPSKVTPTDSRWFKTLKQVIQEYWKLQDGKPVEVLPFLLPAMTDSRWFERLSATGTLRFLPLAQSRATDLRRMHGTDERASVDYFRGALCTTRRVMQLMAGPEGAAIAVGDQRTAPPPVLAAGGSAAEGAAPSGHQKGGSSNVTPPACAAGASAGQVEL